MSLLKSNLWLGNKVLNVFPMTNYLRFDDWSLVPARFMGKMSLGKSVNYNYFDHKLVEGSEPKVEIGCCDKLEKSSLSSQSSQLRSPCHSTPLFHILTVEKYTPIRNWVQNTYDAVCWK